MVKGITKVDPIEKVGETANFRIEIDKTQNTVLIKERNIIVQCPFKLSIKPDEVEEIIKLFTKGIALLRRRH